MPPILLSACAMAGLAACSSPAPVDRTTPDRAAPAADPAPGALRTFGDWVVGCDNVRTCKAVALPPEDAPGDRPAYMLAVERDAGAQGAVRIRLTGEAGAAPPIAVVIDGRRVADGGRAGDVAFTGAQAIAIAGALAAGTGAAIVANGVTGTLSLTGAAAALRYIDDRQGRAGTTGALVARGALPDRGTAPALPVLRAIAASGTPAMPTPALTPAMLAAMRERAGCGIGAYADPVPDAETHALGGGDTLAMVPCDSGAYNLMSALFVLGRDGRPVPAALDAPTGMAPDPPPVAQVVNGRFADGVLTSFAKGRGLGDCGTIQSFVWDGARLRLSALRMMSECRGSIDYITTWRTRVER